MTSLKVYQSHSSLTQALLVMLVTFRKSMRRRHKDTFTRMIYLVTHLMNYNGVCRASPGYAGVC